MRQDTKYPKTMAAFASVEGTVWSVADALAEEVPTTKSGNARAGEYERISKEAAERGFVNATTGKAYSADYLRILREAATFANSNADVRVAFRTYPVQRVLEAKRKAGSDPAKALEILQGDSTTARTIRPSKVGAPKNEAEARAVVRAASREARVAIVQEALIDPDVARDIASDETAQQALVEARLDNAHRKATGRAIRPKNEKLKDGEVEGLLRPGLAYLQIGTHLHHARRNVIDAVGVARDSEVSEALRNLLMQDVEALRELLIDFQLVLEGVKEVSDADLAAWLKAADDDLRERR